MSLFPVIFPVPPHPPLISGREKVTWIRDASREALRICAHFSRINLKNLKKSSLGAPLPFDGTYWSVSHKPLFATAVLGKYPMGIDIEKVKSPSGAVVRKVISAEEDSLCREKKRDDYFFRVWTAKEAVLKAEGIGLQGLSKCRIVQVPDEATMLLNYQEKPYRVIQISFKGHIASVVTNGEPVRWVFPSSSLSA